MDNVTDQQYRSQGQIPARVYKTIPELLKERAKGLEYEPQIIKESHEQKERQKRINEILEESKKFDSSIQQIGKEIYHKYMEFIKAEEEEEQKKKRKN